MKNQCWNHLKSLKMTKDRVKPGTLSLKYPIFTSSMQGSSKSSFSNLTQNSTWQDLLIQHCNCFFTSSQPKLSLAILQPLPTFSQSNSLALSHPSSQAHPHLCWPQSALIPAHKTAFTIKTSSEYQTVRPQYLNPLHWIKGLPKREAWSPVKYLPVGFEHDFVLIDKKEWTASLLNGWCIAVSLKAAGADTQMPATHLTFEARSYEKSIIRSF